MSTTSHLGLPLLAAAQAQKHITHNEALVALDALVHLAVIERGRDGPPATPQQGDRFLVGASPTGAFTGHNGEIAFFDLGLWRFLPPEAGWNAYVKAEDKVVIFDGTAWHDLGHYNRDLDNIDKIGIGTSADNLNRLAAKLNAALFTARSGSEGGTGDLRFVLNKAATANTLSQLYQKGYSGRAETGLVASDDYSIRVSPDGNQWRDALVVDRNTGMVSFPNGIYSGVPGAGVNLLINSSCLINQRAFAGGTLAAGSFGFDRWKGGTGGCTLSRSPDGLITLLGSIEQGVEVLRASSILDLPHLGGKTFTLSVEDPTAPLSVTIGAQTATIPAGAGRRSATVALSASEVGNVMVRLQAAETCSFRRIKLEIGPVATPWSAEPLEIEDARCKRYYQRVPMTGSGYLIGACIGQRVGMNVIEVPFTLPVAMRASASVVTSSLSWSAGSPSANQIGFYDTTAGAWTALSGTLSTSPFGVPGAHGAVIRLYASVSFSGVSGSTGTLFFGTGATIALQSEI